jgi:FkbM family methyltransferase
LLQYGKFFWSDPFLALFNNPDLIRSLIPHSKSSIRQDLFVISELGAKEGGFFVEIGAFDGVTSSNTYMLEKKFNWKGIVCEPQRSVFKKLRVERDCKIDSRAVWSHSSQELNFEELGSGQLSTLSDFMEGGINGPSRQSQESIFRYPVTTVCLNDLLIEHSAPFEIDYISIDTEGSEFSILSTFDFDKFNVRLFTIEHNWDATNRSLIKSIMLKNGYSILYPEISHQDDWYAKI